MLLWLKCFHDDQPPAATRARQREDAGRRIGIVEAVAIGAILLWHFGPEQVPDPGDIRRSVAVSEEAVVADAVLAFGQDMDQEPADELSRFQRHGFVPTGTGDAVIFDAENDVIGIGPDQATVGDGDTVGVSRQVCQHRPGPGEGLLGIHDPVDLALRPQERTEDRGISKLCMVAEETQLPGFVQPGEPVQNEPPVKPRQHTHGQKEVLAASDPLGPIFRQAAPRHDHVDMRVMGHR